MQCFKIGLELFLQGQRTREIVRGEDIPLHRAEDDLDLIEPTGVRRQPGNPDVTCQRQRRHPRAELFGGMRRAVIEHQMDNLQPGAQGTQKQLPQDGCEIGTFSPAACPCNRHSRSNHQGTDSGTAPLRFYRAATWTGAPGAAALVALTRCRAWREVCSSLHTTASPCAANAWACS